MYNSNSYRESDFITKCQLNLERSLDKASSYYNKRSNSKNELIYYKSMNSKLNDYRDFLQLSESEKVAFCRW